MTMTTMCVLLDDWLVNVKGTKWRARCDQVFEIASYESGLGVSEEGVGFKLVATLWTSLLLFYIA